MSDFDFDEDKVSHCFLGGGLIGAIVVGLCVILFHIIVSIYIVWKFVLPNWGT